MANRQSESERALNEGARGGIMNFDATEAVPEAVGGLKDPTPQSGLASSTGRSIPSMPGDTSRDTASTVDSTLGGSSTGSSGGQTTSSTSENILPRDHHGGMNPLKAFTSKGAVGSQFNPEGPLGSIPQAVGGPFDKEGIVGKQFTSEGVIGGTVDKLLGEKKKEDPLGRQK